MQIRKKQALRSFRFRKKVKPALSGKKGEIDTIAELTFMTLKTRSSFD
ncbi:MAG: hypothetical protein ACOX7X_00965 [Methanosarcina flavescens]|nr:hypothetical protein [Methanosarcina flavescens]